MSFLGCICILHSSLLAQDKLNIKFGKVNKEDFNVVSPLIDSNSNAVVVADVGKSEFIENSNDLSFSLVFKQKKRIKILNKNGYDAATISIPLYVGNDGKTEKLSDLSAYTYNLVNGEVVETKLDADQVFTEKRSKNWVLRKFTFPAVKDGSIIEYSYKVTSAFFFNLQPWDFQGEYPVLWSQYEVGIPEFYKFVILPQGEQPFAVNKQDQSVVSYRFTQKVERGDEVREAGKSGTETFKLDGVLTYHTWIMKNVPGLKEEPFTTTINNWTSKIEFQLQQIAFRGSIPSNVTNTWEKLSHELLVDDDFGIPIGRPNNWLDKDLDIITANAVTQRDKAGKIYAYIRDNFTCTEFNRFLITKNLKDIYTNKSGTVADINMLLIAMLRSKNINADPVLLSTREHGIINPFYPLITKFNYVIVRAEVDGRMIYLDAASQRLPFGKLPLRLYNGHARVINKAAESVFFLADSLKETNITNVLIVNMENGGVEGAFNHTAGTYESLDVRDKLAKSTVDEYKKTIKELYPEDIEVSNIEIDSLKLLNEPLSVRYDLKFNGFGNADIVYFNPLLGEALKTNPFSAAVRYYPVEMPYSGEKTYILSMDIPKGYKVDELPKSVRVYLNNNEGMFEYLIENNGQSIQLRCRLQIKKTIFANEDYQTLRDFYTFIVKKEAEQIVFKKIK